MLALLALAACEADSPARCDREVRQAALNEQFDDGSTPSAYISDLFGKATGILQWHGGGGLVEVTPAAGDTSVTISLAHVGEAVRLVDSVRVGGTKYDRLACPDSLEIDASLTIRTEDEALNGNWDVVAVHAFGIEWLVDMQVDFDSGINNGFFSASLRETWTSSQLLIHVVSRTEGFVGELVQLASHEEEELGPIGSGDGVVVQLATFEAL